MTQVYINIPKPSAQVYTNENAQGKEQYDQPDLTYDDIDVFYDGINPTQWTDESKPTTVWNNVVKPT